MSIAVSAVVKPSPVLCILTGAMIGGVAIIGLVIGFGRIGILDFTTRIAISAIVLLVAFLGALCSGQTRKTHHIDISGIGQIRLVETNAVVAPRTPSISLQRHEGGEVVGLMADSTLWPFLLVLRLKTDDGRIKVLPVLPDSMGIGEFRALSVACRWIAAHNNPADRTNL